MNFVSKHHQRGLGLSSCADQGQVFWRRDNGLVFGIVAGMQATGEKMLIVNDPVQRTLDLQCFEFQNGRWFADPENRKLDHLSILEKAFVALKTYGVDANEKYPPDFKFDFTPLCDVKPAVAFDLGFFKIVGHLLMVKETKNSIGRLARKTVGLPKRAFSKSSTGVKAKSESSHV